MGNSNTVEKKTDTTNILSNISNDTVNSDFVVVNDYMDNVSSTTSASPVVCDKTAILYSLCYYINKRSIHKINNLENIFNHARRYHIDIDKLKNILLEVVRKYDKDAVLDDNNLIRSIDCKASKKRNKKLMYIIKQKIKSLAA